MCVFLAENLLGEEGKGFKIAMSILNNGRTGLGGGCVGAMKACIEMASKQAAERKQFGESIANFGLIKEKLSQMTVNCFAAESVVAMVAHYIDSGSEDFAVEAAASKVFASEALWSTVYEALQVAGGNGFMREFPYERITRDCRINMIFEGTNEILRLFIALSGMKAAGAYLKDVGEGIGNLFNDPIKGFGVMSGYATRKWTQATSLGRDKVEAVHEELSGESEVLERMVIELSKATETVLRRHGKEIIGKQFAMKRLANIAIDIFVGFCVLSRVSTMLNEQGVENCNDELSIAQIFVKQAELRIKDILIGIERNEDEIMKALSDSAVAHEGYRWDLI